MTDAITDARALRCAPLYGAGQNVQPGERSRVEARPRRARVLVIDDEPSIGTTLRILLADDFDVTALTRARDALAEFEAGERFDVVLCDLMMPDMDGMELFAALDRVAPELAPRFVFLTGGAFTDASRDFLDRVPNARLEKPFDVATLRRMLRDVAAAERT